MTTNDLQQQLIDEMRKADRVDKAVSYRKKDYVIAKDDYFAKIECHLGNILSVYQIGTISVPGISDIDYFVVFKNDASDDIGNYYIAGLKAEAQYLFSHNGWFVNKDIFSHLPYWFPYFDLVKVWGETIEVDEKDKNNEQLLMLILCQYLITKVPVDFITYSFRNGLFYERIMLCMINSLSHTLKLVKYICKTIPDEWGSFLCAFTEFRKKWFTEKDSPKSERLIEFAAGGIVIACEVLEYVSAYIRQSLTISKNSGEMTCLLGKNKLLFTSQWRLDQAIHLAFQEDSRVSSLPIEIGYYIHLWSKEKGDIGRYIRANTCGGINVDIDPKVEELFRKHASILEKYQQFSRKKFACSAPGYHTLWTPVAANRLGRLTYKIKRRLFGLKSR